MTLGTARDERTKNYCPPPKILNCDSEERKPSIEDSSTTPSPSLHHHHHHLGGGDSETLPTANTANTTSPWNAFGFQFATDFPSKTQSAWQAFECWQQGEGGAPACRARKKYSVIYASSGELILGEIEMSVDIKMEWCVCVYVCWEGGPVHAVERVLLMVPRDGVFLIIREQPLVPVLCHLYSLGITMAPFHR